MRKWILVAAMMVVGGFVYAGTDSYLRHGEPDLTTCERALDLLSKGERAGFDVLFEQWPDKSPAGKAKMEELTDTHAPIVRRVTTLGDLCGIELVHAEEVGSFLRRYSYVCKYEQGRVRWLFTFYRPGDKWRFDGYGWTTDENSLFAECGHSISLPVDGDEVRHHVPANTERR